MPQITVREFEEKVLAIEEIAILLRASTNELVEDYTYQKKASREASVTEWLDTRIKPLIGDIQPAVIDGEYRQPHGRTRLERLRNSYDK
ncbi:MAG: hypothetical protein COA37_17690 [Hoeflea sp.]|uniref:hypothetical protein n=1 Tax=Hoeflea sp. TaxID=1940281 RepID=UPI000C0D9696|nr:hypothetical protein [Hoeflea sp.]PHR19263.1 MAG: hypothetical protein COA37_17690 [Hoeflea sp.]